MRFFNRGLRLWLRAALLTGACCAGAFLSGGSVRADDASTRYFEGLRQRRLFTLAEGYCLDRLSRKTVPADREADLTLELSRTFAEHAQYTTGPQQEELWSHAERVVDDFLQAHPDDPKRVRMEVQRALLPAGRGEFLRWQTVLFPYDKTLQTKAVSTLEDAVSRLGDVEKRLGAELRRAFARDALPQGVLSPYELRRLQSAVRYQLGAARLNQAKLSAEGSPARMSHLLDAEEWLRPLAGGVPGEDVTWQSRILLADAARLRSDFPHTANLLTSIENDDPPSNVRDAVIAGRVRLLLDQHQPTDAAQLLIEYRRQRAGADLPGELRYLKVKAILALWEVAARNNDAHLADDLLSQAQTNVQRIEREVGGFWGYRCRLLLDAAEASQKYGPELAQMIRKAAALYGNGQIEEAIESYGNAAVAALQDDRSDLAMQLGYTRASIQTEAQHYAQAADSLRELVDRFPQSDRTADAHLLWAWCLGKLYQQESTADRRTAYADALQAHRRQFREHPSAVEATWMLARLEETTGQISRALDLYAEIPADHPRGPEAHVAVARCYETLLDRLREQGQPTQSREQEAINRLTPWATGGSDDPSAQTSLNANQAEVALRLARIHLNRERPDYANADQLLRRVFEVQSPDSNVQSSESSGLFSGSGLLALDSRLLGLRKTATQLRIVSLAGQGRMQEARLLVRNLSGSRPADVLSVLAGLGQLADRFDDETRRALGELQLEASERLQQRRAELQPEQLEQLDRCRVQALLATNQPQRALEVYETLVTGSPGEVQLLRTMADLLAKSGTEECLRKAKSTWRRVESLEHPGSRDWLQARYHVARCAFALKQYQECRKLLGVTRLLYPDLGGADLRSQYQRLQQNLESLGPIH